MSCEVLAILQARVSSTRLPGKVLMDLGGRPLLSFLLERLKSSKLIDKIVIATTENVEDNKIEEIGLRAEIDVIRGSENDVLGRFVKAQENIKADTIVRITGDCPLIDSEVIDKTILEFRVNKYDYLSNCNPPSYPDGLDVEVFTRKSLLQANQYAFELIDREHVTMWIKNSDSFKKGFISNDINLSHLRLTVDEPEDLELIRYIVNHFNNNSSFSFKDIVLLYESNPDIFSINSMFKRNEGAFLSSGQKLWSRAKRVIPGGNMLLSKRPEMFLPRKWPTYYSRAKNCHVWDLDDVKYTDLSFMGVGTNILGYAVDEIDMSVKDSIDKSNMSTLNCPEEVLLAEKLVDLHPWAEMVRFARTGGEANAIAIRIARAATGLDDIAICGYHGWHDWYLSTNLNSSESLDEHLLPGLPIAGVPKNLKDTVHPFSYNNLEEFKSIVEKYQLAAVKMEVERSTCPDENFLSSIRRICNDNNIILIFDECTSGFRETFGGLHKKYKIDPDIAIFGKALGNGYAISSVIGRSSIMEYAQRTFISSTFWTERIGPTAALKTLEIMEREKSWQYITKQGKKLREGFNLLAENHGLKILNNGIAALCGYTFKSIYSLKYKTFITQEMLKKGFLATNSCYLSISHSDKIIGDYLSELDPIFKKISQCEDGLPIDSLLETSCCHKGFERLN